MHAAAFTPLSRRRIGAAALTPLSRRRSDAAASHAAAFFGCSIACTPPHPCTPPHMPPHAGHRIHAALAGALCRWKRTTRSAFFNAEHDAGGREPGRFNRRGRARGGAGGGGAGRGAVFEKGCFGVGWGGVLCTYISPKGVCDGGVKNRGWGWKSGQKETPSGQKVTPSGQFVRKVGKSALELGKKKSIICQKLFMTCIRIHKPKQDTQIEFIL